MAGRSVDNAHDDEIEGHDGKTHDEDLPRYVLERAGVEIGLEVPTPACIGDERYREDHHHECPADASRIRY